MVTLVLTHCHIHYVQTHAIRRSVREDVTTVAEEQASARLQAGLLGSLPSRWPGGVFHPLIMVVIGKHFTCCILWFPT